jgi:hypothetical protein
MEKQKQFTHAHLDMIIKCKENLLDLCKEGILSIESVEQYEIMLSSKFDEIYNSLNTNL